jgi:hypothetical protein
MLLLKYGIVNKNMTKEAKKEISELDLQEIARLISEGNTSGILDSDGFRIVWDLDLQKIVNS